MEKFVAKLNLIDAAGEHRVIDISDWRYLPRQDETLVIREADTIRAGGASFVVTLVDWEIKLEAENKVDNVIVMVTATEKPSS